MQRNDREKIGGFFMSLVRSSIILGALDRLTVLIYRWLKTGFFGYIFTGYPTHSRFAFGEWFGRTRLAGGMERIRKWFCRSVEESFFVRRIPRIGVLLLGCRLKVYGTFISSFGAYTAAAEIVRMLLAGDILIEEAALSLNITIGAVLLVSGIPLILSRKTLSEALCQSLAGGLIQKLTGFTEEDMRAETGGGHVSIAFFAGLLFGLAAYQVSPILLIGGAVALVGAYLVLVRPEIGVLALFFFMPILPTVALLAIELYTFFCYIIKLIRRKRVFRLEPVDIAAAAFAFVLLTGGVISASPASLMPAFLYVGFLCAYFLVVGLIRSTEWLTRCTVASVVSAVLISVYGLFTYFTGTAEMAPAWLDTNLFGSIRGRAYATLENPNMYGEYLALVIPLAFGILLRRWGGMRKSVTVLSLGILGAGLLCSWSRGALLALLLAMIVFMFMWHRRAVFLVFAGLAAVPFLPLVLPEAVVSRYFDIGNMADSSTSYRVGGWQAAFEMLKNNFLAGIGIGREPWASIYPRYALMSQESTPHAHNLYLQIAMEVGIVGLFVFIAFLFLLYQSGFTFFARLSDESIPLPESLSLSDVPPTSDANRNIRRIRQDLRVSAAAPLCGVLAVLVQGMTDYAWYNYRVYLMMWLVCGLASAYIRSGSEVLEHALAETSAGDADGYSVDVD